MAFVHFKVEVDADGIALVTWDSPGRSMNVIDLKSIEELGAIVEKVATETNIKGAVITSGKDAFCAGADLTMLEGELVLHEDSGETVLKPGDAAGWRANGGIGHCLINRTGRDALYLEIGTRAATERGHYPDCDLVMERDAKGMRFLHRSGEPYPQES